MTIIDRAINNNIRRDTIARAYDYHIRKAIEEALYYAFKQFNPDSTRESFNQFLEKEVDENIQ